MNVNNEWPFQDQILSITVQNWRTLSSRKPEQWTCSLFPSVTNELPFKDNLQVPLRTQWALSLKTSIVTKHSLSLQFCNLVAYNFKMSPEYNSTDSKTSVFLKPWTMTMQSLLPHFTDEQLFQDHLMSIIQPFQDHLSSRTLLNQRSLSWEIWMMNLQSLPCTTNEWSFQGDLLSI